uniref:Related to Zinc finger protein n=1 Tax=Melanopsichium pennsylvanicum 4 TaxID=1398559 RepID=A0A077QV59_9BASI|nr:related to Zinc finger protein [Melanopsichium pennsylvanicum 4]
MDILELVHEDQRRESRPFDCQQPGCPKAFSSKAFSDSSSLARHRRIHTGRRPYKCLVPGCAKSFCRKTTLTKHTRRNHADAEGSYTGIGGPTTIMSNSISMNRCALPPHSRSTFPQGLEHHYLAALKVEEGSNANAGFGFQTTHQAEYPGTPYSAAAMSTCPSSSTSCDELDLGRRSSVAASASYSSTSFHSANSNSNRACPTPSTLTPASEISYFPRTPDVRDARAFEVFNAKPHFNHFSVAGTEYAGCEAEQHGATAGFHSSVISHGMNFGMMPSGYGVDQADASSIDPNLWNNGVQVGHSFYENQPNNQAQPRGNMPY